MQMMENPVRAKLKAGKVTLGCFIPMPSPEITEIVALAGFDFAFLDGEHGRISPDDAYAMVLACEARGVPAFARVGQNDRQVILKFLDLGVAGVMIPQTTSTDDCQRAIQAMRYWPDGVRGLANGRTFDYGMGQPMADLVPKINDRVCTIIQFEHIDSLPYLEEMLALPGLDVLFVGPSDLSQSMGFPGKPFNPETEKVIKRVVDAARGTGVALGIVAPDAEMTKRRIDEGFQMIVSNVPGLLAKASRDLIASSGRDA
jgi:4-hydroxy-2-oxoheptanedioate aldolase